MDYRRFTDGSSTKRGVAALAAVALAITLSACGGGSEVSSPVSQAQAQSPAAPDAATRQQAEAAALAQAMTMARTINANPMRNERPRMAGN